MFAMFALVVPIRAIDMSMVFSHAAPITTSRMWG
jgi:hypothetical protein